MARLQIQCCFVVFIAMVCRIEIVSGYYTRYYTALDTLETTTTAPPSKTPKTALPCAGCPTCPIGYSPTNVYISSSGCPRCMCEWSGYAATMPSTTATTANYASSTKAISNNLLMKILLNLGHNAEAVNMLATNLDEEAKIAADIAKQ